MIWLIDIFLLLSVVLTVTMYVYRGFIKSLFDLCSGIMSFLLAYIFFPYLGKAITRFLSINKIVTNILSYIILFVFFAIAFSVAAIILDKIFSLPVLKSVNKMLGFLLGVAISSFNLIIICSVITFVLNIINVQNPSITQSNIADRTIIYGFISKIDFISYLILNV